MGCHLTGSEVGLIACYGFDQGINEGNNSGITSLEDCTSNNLDGSLHNFALTGPVSNWVALGAALTGSCICEDADMDTYTICDGDCDDTNAAIYPGATRNLQCAG